MRELKIAVANSRNARKWTNRGITWEALLERLSTTQKTVESIEEFLANAPKTISFMGKTFETEVDYYGGEG